jgi:hypothetical protein
LASRRILLGIVCLPLLVIAGIPFCALLVSLWGP